MTPNNPSVKIAPSLLAANFAALGDEVDKVAAGGADWIHFDVMDGHFVPNLTIGPVIVKSVRDRCALPFDVHLMIEEPQKYIDPFADAGADIITFHTEVTDRPAEVARQIRDRGARVGISLNPDQPASTVLDCLDFVDLVLVMTVFPGFGGQKFIDDTLPKIAEIRAAAGPDKEIEVDGGIDAQTVTRAAAAGANVFVAGTATFRAPDAAAAIHTIRQAATEAQDTQGET